MGTITKRGDRQFQVKVRKAGYPTESTTFETKADAKAWMQRVESEMHVGTFRPTSLADNTLLKTILDKYVAEVAITKKSSADIKCLLGAIGKRLGGYSLSALTSAKVSEYKNQRLTVNKLSNESVRKELGMLNRVIKKAQQEWNIHLPLGNPVTMVEYPPKDKPRERRLKNNETIDERTVLQTLANSSRGMIKYLLPFAIATAMRRNEIVNLARDDIDFKNEVAKLYDTKNGDCSGALKLAT